MRHVRRHQSEVDNSEFNELLHTVTQTAINGPCRLATKANELYSLIFLKLGAKL